MTRYRPGSTAGSRVVNSMISAGCVIEGEVLNSILSPGVKVGAGARVQDSIIFHDCVIENNSQVDLAILDKRVRVGQGSVIGSGDNKELPNSKYPDHLYTGISLVGKEVDVPPGTTIGRNCIINPGIQLGAFPGSIIQDGETV